ncbi:ribonuclease P protein subunit p30-like [Amphiura filiformis]|uniref:ribonuclease P protein subunit p30-like n=1 Tax=Amphiura filiformis TaxID=82378 RepID=UPI003B21F30A
MVVFHDLNLPYDANQKQLKRSISCAEKLGYDVVAVGHHCTVIDKTSPIPAPPPVDLDSDQTDRNQPVKQLSRVTVVLGDGAQTHRLRADNVQSYDILAVQPTNNKMFHMACTALEIDIISVNMAEKVPFYFKTHPVKCALERGVYFEIPYAPAIRDSTIRRHVISNALNLVRACRGRNIIISSFANKPLELRGPHDVVNLGLLFGMNENQAKDAVQRNCRAVIMHAATRKSIRSSMDIQEISQLPEQDAWKVKSSQEASGFEEMSTHQDTASKAKKRKRQRDFNEDRKGGEKMKKR